jgi:hypothetical protein
MREEKGPDLVSDRIQIGMFVNKVLVKSPEHAPDLGFRREIEKDAHVYATGSYQCWRKTLNVL